LITVKEKVIHFDLISDLHIDYWPTNQQIKWPGLGTSLVAVVAGDVSRSWTDTYDYLMMLRTHYRHVVFIDGNHEHDMQPGLKFHSDILHDKLAGVGNITYLHRNSIILDNVAFIGCNGWWTYDFAQPEFSIAEAWEILQTYGFTSEHQEEIIKSAKQDAQTLVNIIKTFNADPNVKKIVVVTHTAPQYQFRYITPGSSPVHYAKSGSSFLANCLEYDTNKKIRAWCFGHCHTEADQVVDGIRYVCHPRGRPEDGTAIYYPKLIEV
jgi:predicted phosphodiesterase